MKLVSYNDISDFCCNKPGLIPGQLINLFPWTPDLLRGEATFTGRSCHALVAAVEAFSPNRGARSGSECGDAMQRGLQVLFQ